MDNETAGAASNPPTTELAQDLFALRDSLMELAMAFRDMQFEIDAGKRDTASQEVGHMIERINAMVTGAKPSGPREPD